MKIIIKICSIIIMIFAVPVFAEDGVTIENIIGTTLNENVVLNATDSIDLAFNDLNQNASYKITLKNNTDEVIYVNDVIVENLSETFIDFTLTDKSLNTMIEPGKQSVVEVDVNTLDITHAGRNVNDEIKLKFLLGDSIINPETSTNFIIYIIIVVLLLTLSSIFVKFDKKKIISIFVIGTLVLGITMVSASDDNVLVLSGKVKYTSQNLLQESGTELEGYNLNYANAVGVWKYAEQVKNIIIADNKVNIEKYDYCYDLTASKSNRINGYLVKNGDNQVIYDLYIVSNGVMYAPENATGLFSFPNVETITGLKYVEFDNTTNMTAMFMNNEKLTNIDTGAINTDNVTNTNYMFSGCDNLVVSEDNFNMENVSEKTHMFNQKLSDLIKVNAKSDKDVIFSNKSVAGNYVINSTENDENPIYYYRGNVTNNNVLFADKCWQMVRTTDKGGVKLVYNGTPNSNYKRQLKLSEYMSVSNKSASPFKFDSNTLKAYSTNKTDNSNSSISFYVPVAGYYVINYSVSSEKNGDYAYFYNNSSLVKKVSGTESGNIYLGKISPTTKITVKYVKNGSTSSGSDRVVFDISYVTMKCYNKGEDSGIAVGAYNYMASQVQNFGYMYGTEFDAKKISLSSLGDNVTYGNSIKWNGSKYILEDTISPKSFEEEKDSILQSKHYACLDYEYGCEKAYYILDVTETDMYFTKLINGNDYIDLLNKASANNNSSNIKNVIDNWYKENLLDYASRLEDSVFCGNRTFATGALAGKNYNVIDGNYTHAHQRVFMDFKPSLECSKNDSFTVKDTRGNTALHYPIGLLSADELVLAGATRLWSNTSYLNINANQWTMSNIDFSVNSARVAILNNYGAIEVSNGYSSNVIRPSIVLNNDSYYIAGTGTVSEPYIVN